MKRFSALLRDTWWLWIILLIGGIVLGTFVSFVFYIAIPICFFSFIYFGLMRYDEHGNSVGDRDG